MRTEIFVNVTLLLISWILPSQAQIAGHIVGADYTDIKRYPHSALLGISCVFEGNKRNWMCGSSILNQHIILSAAHCLESCVRVRSFVSVTVGNAHKSSGLKSSVKRFKIHERYAVRSTINDIALLVLRTPLKFSLKISRVSIMKRPPQHEVAYVAGWGKVDEINKIGTQKLKHTNQTIWTRSACMKILGRVPPGCFCGGSVRAKNYASMGDSGSALVVRGYIQIGIVSHKLPRITRSLVVYTDVGYYYDWIKRNSKQIYCGKKYK